MRHYSPYYSYHRPSIGRANHFLYHYCNLSVAEQATYGWPSNEVKYYGEVLATMEWEGSTPVFKFTEKYKWAEERQAMMRKDLENDDGHVEYLQETFNKFIERLQSITAGVLSDTRMVSNLDKLVTALPDREMSDLIHTIKFWKSCADYDAKRREAAAASDADIDRT